MKKKDLRTASIVGIVIGLILIGAYLNSSGTFSQPRPALVRIQVGDTSFEFKSTDRIPGNWLVRAGFRLYPGDEVIVSGEVVPPDEPLSYRSVYEVELQRNKEVILTKDGETRQINTQAETLGEALWQAGIPLREADFLTISPGLPVNGSLFICDLLIS